MKYELDAPVEYDSYAPDGGVILKFRIRQLQSLLHWVLTWNGAVKVFGPDKLVEMTKESLITRH